MNIFKQLFTSIYSPRTISTFRFQGIGKTILFVFILTLVSTIPSAYYFGTEISNGLKGFHETIKNELPAFSIKDGELSADSDTPIEIRHDDFIIVLDDTGTNGVEELEEMENAIGILKDRFVIAAAGQVQSYEYRLLNMTLTNEDIINFSEGLNQILPIVNTVFIVFMFLFGAFFKFLEVTLLALFGLMFKNSLQRQLNFKQIWIVSAYATTLATAFFFIMDCLQISVPSGFLLNWFVNIIVLFLSLKEIPPTTKALQ
ncbi:DUF1189 domain-containing protein [Virgibacillus sp. 6R]|uniref:DUF1189 domain-containing protein n=1 Tax=Metabacillus sp. 22489 TaxID=3453928 RepID=UPI0011AA3C58